MFIPSQGFRHAAALLLTNSARAIAADASPETTRSALSRLARELAALADDMRATADTSAWLIDELNTTIDRLPQSFDRAAAKADAAAVLACLGSREPTIEARDLFLVYVPEDRLPVAAPLAVELTKRRISIAFAGYEIATSEQFSAAIARGLAHHMCGVVLSTRAFERAGWPLPSATERIRILRDPIPTSAVPDLVAWVNTLRLSNS